jgi:hypothetical protein
LAVNFDVEAVVEDGSCEYDFEICDCSNISWSPSELDKLGNGVADDGTSGPNFNCSTWGFDCGDIPGAPAEDPNGVCLGNLPPNNGCAVSVNETEVSAWNVYPNPGVGNLTLVNSTGSPAQAIDIFDASGRLLFSVEPEQVSGNDVRIELQGKLASGSYFLRVITSTSQTTLPILIVE